jgi:hypothetical protein
VVRVGVEDCFCASAGPYEEMVAHYGLDAAAIVAAAHRALERKRIHRQRTRLPRRPAAGASEP